tara:strand:- start:3925 stop:4782 length:858 start_codon:yes stop_codon:yes gene_type:complete
MTAQFLHFSKIKPINAKRLSCGIPEVDWMYGHNDNSTTYGLPRVALSLWGGSAGVGKTRACMTVARSLLASGKMVVFFTLEMPPGHYRKKYCKGIAANAKLFVSEARSLKEQTDVIRTIIHKHGKPDLIVVDSVNKIAEFRNGYGTDIIERQYRKIIAFTESHVIFITHLNQKGLIKGGSNLPHMVDTVFTITSLDDYCFEVNLPEKNRFGKTGVKTVWTHKDHGAQCDSEFRYDDEDWVKAHYPGWWERKKFLRRVRKEQEREERQMEKMVDKFLKKEKLGWAG